MGKVSGPVEDQKLIVTVTDLPPVVLEVNHNSRPGTYEPAEFISLGPGKVARLPILVRRYDGSNSPLTLEPESPVEGLDVREQHLSPGQVDLRIETAGRPIVQARPLQAPRRHIALSPHHADARKPGGPAVSFRRARLQNGPQQREGEAPAEPAHTASDCRVRREGEAPAEPAHTASDCRPCDGEEPKLSRRAGPQPHPIAACDGRAKLPLSRPTPHPDCRPARQEPRPPAEPAHTASDCRVRREGEAPAEPAHTASDCRVRREGEAPAEPAHTASDCRPARQEPRPPAEPAHTASDCRPARQEPRPPAARTAAAQVRGTSRRVDPGGPTRAVLLARCWPSCWRPLFLFAPTPHARRPAPDASSRSSAS